jgi:hypothetical protein
MHAEGGRRTQFIAWFSNSLQFAASSVILELLSQESWVPETDNSILFPHVHMRAYPKVSGLAA